MSNGSRTSSTAAAALRVLRMLAEYPGGARISDVAEFLGSGKSTAHLLLATLVEQGFAERTEESRYRLGITAFEVGSAVPEAVRFGGALVGPMQALADLSGEAVSLAIVRGRDAIIVQRFETRHILRAEIGIGTRMPLLSCASGKFLLAHMSDAEVDALYPDEDLPHVTRNSIRTRTRLRAMFPAIREQGYAVNEEEYAEGISGLGTGVRGPGGGYLAALSLAGPTSRFTVANWVDPLLSAAAEMDILLAGSTAPARSIPSSR
jgi:DNA-binding IclR family transcriptional regulator